MVATPSTLNWTVAPLSGDPVGPLVTVAVVHTVSPGWGCAGEVTTVTADGKLTLLPPRMTV